jgi:hypothetical protein
VLLFARPSAVALELILPYHQTAWYRSAAYLLLAKTVNREKAALQAEHLPKMWRDLAIANQWPKLKHRCNNARSAGNGSKRFSFVAVLVSRQMTSELLARIDWASCRCKTHRRPGSNQEGCHAYTNARFETLQYTACSNTSIAILIRVEVSQGELHIYQIFIHHVTQL